MCKQHTPAKETFISQLLLSTINQKERHNDHLSPLRKIKTSSQVTYIAPLLTNEGKVSLLLMFAYQPARRLNIKPVFGCEEMKRFITAGARKFYLNVCRVIEAFCEIPRAYMLPHSSVPRPGRTTEGGVGGGWVQGLVIHFWESLHANTWPGAPYGSSDGLYLG